MKRNFAISMMALALVTGGTLAAQQARTPDGHPDLQGIWNSASGTPMERPNEFKGKEFLSEQEAAAWQKKMVVRSKQPDYKPGDGHIGSYNDVFWEMGTRPVKTLRTSMVVDPADGRIPALTPTAAAERARRLARTQHPDGADDLGLGDRCLMFSTASPPMTPYIYNSNYRIVQTRDQVAISVEMVHDTRIIPLDGRPHLPANVRLWMGDSVGHWEGETLVVDTTNFGDTTSFYGSDRNLHVVERFRRFDAETLLYQFEVDDPTAFTRPWKGEYTMEAATGPLFEYACHEGNYALPDLLKGERADERAAAKAAK
jgi:hypothetical protein